MAEPISDEVFFATLSTLIDVVEASGFTTVDAPQPTWWRTTAEGDDGTIEEKLVLWRHPRRLFEVQGYIATSRLAAMVHLRLFDPDWQPETLLPGSLGKGWPFDDVSDLDAVAETMASVVWPRALAWFEAPVDGNDLMLSQGRIPSLIGPGPLLERHRQRARWLRERGDVQEADYVDQLIAEIEDLYRSVEDA